jgi:DNA polymerase (family 10)
VSERPSNAEVAERLQMIGDLLEIEGADRHRVMAYRRGASRIRVTPANVVELALAGRAVELPDIGTTLQAKIVELATTGDIEALAKLRESTPEGVARLARIEGIGPKRAEAIWKALGIDDIDGLRAAAREGRLELVPGLGPKTRQAILESLNRAPIGASPEAERVPMGRVLPLAEEMVAFLVAQPGVQRAEIAGSIRRGRDTVHDVDVVVASNRPDLVLDAVAGHPAVDAILSRGEAGLSAATHIGVPLEVRVSPPGAFGNLFQHATGSAAHNVRLREAARRRGLSVSERGISSTGDVSTHEDEAGVYAALGLAWIPPEIREDRGELDLAREGAVPQLVERGDLRGDLHAHTSWSDGKATIEQMARGAVARGYRYLAITDHSRSLAFAGGLDRERVLRQWQEIDAVQQRLPDIRLLKGAEVDILADGSLDADEDILEGFDWVVASLHSGLRRDAKDITARILRAMEHPAVRAIGHPTGRMMGRRPGAAIDIERVAEKAVETRTALEVNAQPLRLDLPDELARTALALGADLLLSSDAHSVPGLDMIRLAVTVARRAGAEPGRVVNCRPLDVVLTQA